MFKIKTLSWLLFITLTAIFASSNTAYSQSEQLKLTWSDNASNEDGTKVERGSVSAGPYTEIFSLVGANLITFTDGNLNQATDYCYRIRAFNAGGFSGYSNTACATTPAVLTVVKIGTGQGTVSSAPVGISCGVTCTAKFSGKSLITLTAVVTSGSVFDGWSGACTGTASTCTVTMDAAKSVTASFSTIGVPAAPSNLVATPVLP